MNKMNKISAGLMFAAALAVVAGAGATALGATGRPMTVYDLGRDEPQSFYANERGDWAVLCIKFDGVDIGDELRDVTLGQALKQAAKTCPVYEIRYL